MAEHRAKNFGTNSRKTQHQESNSDNLVVKFEDLSKSLQLSGIQQYINLLEEEMPTFLSNYKNPCWREETGPGSGRSQLRCLPYYYIAGFPKCGTTDLFYHISLHPMISEVHRKETSWWNRRRVQMCDNKSNETLRQSVDVQDAHLCGETLRDYLDFNQMTFDVLESYTISSKGSQEPYHPMIFGDGTPGAIYMLKYWQYLPENKGCDIKKGPCFNIAHYIHHFTPAARIIVTMRNPARQVYSWYIFFHGNDMNQFHELVLDEINLIESCLTDSTLWACASNYTHGVLKEKKVNLIFALYYPFVAEWLKVFPRQQMYFTQTEHYSKVNRVPVLKEIFEFLDLDPLDMELEDEIVNSEVRKNRTDVQATVGQMLPETRKILDKFFEPYNQMLADLLHDKKWLFQG